MKLLCLYNNACALDLFAWLKQEGNEVTICEKKLDEKWCKDQKFDLTVSYTYRYILSETVLFALGNNVVNIHNSYLPWNRGADPNIWSIIEETPRGVSLHYINTGLDKGDIIAQRIVNYSDSDETLKSTYENLDRAAKDLFKQAFKYYEYWPKMRKRTLGNGSYHSVKDGEKIRKLIDTYELPVETFKQLVKRLF